MGRIVARILVIDDDDLVRSTVEAMLQTMGHEIVLASNGDQGLRQLEAGPVDLIITDVFMPQKEGIETLREMRRRGIKTAVIVMTGGPSVRLDTHRRADVNYLQMAKTFGANATIQKPFSRQQLLAVVDEWLAPTKTSSVC
jgi:CheY-like chemotaxis protein